jgi:hypothetical protein
MRDERRKAILTAALALLLLGISAGVGPGHHGCRMDLPAVASGSPHSFAPDDPHADAIAGSCVACLLTAQLSSLGLSVVAGWLPPPLDASIRSELPAPVVSVALPAPSTRAPPLA